MNESNKMLKFYIYNGYLIVQKDSKHIQIVVNNDYERTCTGPELIMGIIIGNNALVDIDVDINDDNREEISNSLSLLNFFHVDNVYANISSSTNENRLIKRAEEFVPSRPEELCMNYDIGDSFTIDNGSSTNFSSYMYYAPQGLLFPDFQNKVDNDKIIKEQYGPTIDRTWLFEAPVSNPEWMLQDTR